MEKSTVGTRIRNEENKPMQAMNVSSGRRGCCGLIAEKNREKYKESRKNGGKCVKLTNANKRKKSKR